LQTVQPWATLLGHPWVKLKEILLGWLKAQPWVIPMVRPWETLLEPLSASLWETLQVLLLVQLWVFPSVWPSAKQLGLPWALPRVMQWVWQLVQPWETL